MIETSIEELFNSINNSKEYKEYKEIVDIIDKDKEIKNLIKEIKTLQKKATHLEYNKDNKYKEIDELIKEKINILNENSKYKEYLTKLKTFNNTLLASSTLLEDYIDNKVSI